MFLLSLIVLVVKVLITDSQTIFIKWNYFKKNITDFLELISTAIKINKVVEKVEEKRTSLKSYFKW